MRIHQPKMITWWIAVGIAVLALLAALPIIPTITPYAVWIALIGFVLLAIGNVVKGL